MEESKEAWRTETQRAARKAAKRRREARLKERDPARVKARQKHKNLRRNYKMSREEYEQRLAQQNGVCAICRQPERVQQKGVLRTLSVDHDHATGRVRGLLCHGCNIALGNLRDDPSIARAAAVYLELPG